MAGDMTKIAKLKKDLTALETEENLSQDEFWTDERVLFPPNVIGYRNQVSAARQEMWAYISHKSIVLVKPFKNDDKTNSKEKTKLLNWPLFSLIGISRVRYNCLSFCQAPWCDLPIEDSPLVSACTLGVLRIWNVKNGTCSIYQDLDSMKCGCAGLDWSPVNPNKIFAIDVEGSLKCWNIGQNSLIRVKFNQQVSCLKASPIEDDVVAFGTNNGTIYVVEATDSVKIRWKLCDEPRRIQSIAWSPQGCRWDAFDNGNSFLVSTTLADSLSRIKVWNGKGKFVSSLYCATRRDQCLKNSAYAGNLVQWIRLGRTTGLVSSGPAGAVLLWDKSPSCRIIHQTTKDSSTFGFVQTKNILWCMMNQPLITGFNLDTNKIEFVVPTFYGVNCLAPCPFASSPILIGGVDSWFRALRLDEGNSACNSMFQIPKIFNPCKVPIATVAWHPYKDGYIALGTTDGKVGTHELREDNKVVNFIKSFYGCIYSLTWGPTVYTNSDSSKFEAQANKNNRRIPVNYLYVCSSQCVYLFNPSRANYSPMNALKIVKQTNSSWNRFDEFTEITEMSEKATEILWSPDFETFSIGYKDGRVELYSRPNLRLICWIKCHNRDVQHMSWRPFDFNEDRPSDHPCKLFATSSNDGSVRIFNMKTYFDNADEKKESQASSQKNQVSLVLTSDITFQGHGGYRVIMVDWSPHDPELIVSVSYDYTAVVWNVEKKIPIARYCGHKSRLVSCMFHPTNPQVIMTASDEPGMDCSLHMWDFTKQPYVPKARKNFSRFNACAPKPCLINTTTEHEVKTQGIFSVKVKQSASKNLLSNVIAAYQRQSSRHCDLFRSVIPAFVAASSSSEYLFQILIYFFYGSKIKIMECSVEAFNLELSKKENFKQASKIPLIKGCEPILIGPWETDPALINKFLNLEKAALIKGNNILEAARIALWMNDWDFLLDLYNKGML